MFLAPRSTSTWRWRPVSVATRSTKSTTRTCPNGKRRGVNDAAVAVATQRIAVTSNVDGVASLPFAHRSQDTFVLIAWR